MNKSKQIILLDDRYFTEETLKKMKIDLPNAIIILCGFPMTDPSMIKVFKV